MFWNEGVVKPHVAKKKNANRHMMAIKTTIRSPKIDRGVRKDYNHPVVSYDTYGDYRNSLVQRFLRKNKTFNLHYRFDFLNFGHTFDYRILNGVKVTNSSFSHCNFMNSVNRIMAKEIALENVRFKNCSFEFMFIDSSTLKNVVFENCVFNERTRIENSTIDEIKFIECKFAYLPEYNDCIASNVVYENVFSKMPIKSTQPFVIFKEDHIVYNVQPTFSIENGQILVSIDNQYPIMYMETNSDSLFLERSDVIRHAKENKVSIYSFTSEFISEVAHELEVEEDDITSSDVNKYVSRFGDVSYLDFCLKDVVIIDNVPKILTSNEELCNGFKGIIAQLKAKYWIKR